MKSSISDRRTCRASGRSSNQLMQGSGFVLRARLDPASDCPQQAAHLQQLLTRSIDMEKACCTADHECAQVDTIQHLRRPRGRSGTCGAGTFRNSCQSLQDQEYMLEVWHHTAADLDLRWFELRATVTHHGNQQLIDSISQ
jgi:hypothetical protein